LKGILNAIDGFISLYPAVTLDWGFTERMKGPFKVDALHYLINSGQGKKGEAESAGFLFQQPMHLNGIGSVWLGGPKDVEINPAGIVATAFGEPKEVIRRQRSEFRRKPIAKIINSPDDPSHLAPSGLNPQPWYWEKTDDRLLLPKRLLKLPISLFYKLTEVDLGIALCHYALAYSHFYNPFIFKRHGAKSSNKGFQLFGR